MVVKCIVGGRPSPVGLPAIPLHITAIISGSRAAAETLTAAAAEAKSWSALVRPYAIAIENKMASTEAAVTNPKPQLRYTGANSKLLLDPEVTGVNAE